MARIAGIDLPNNKRGEIGLTYIFGIGKARQLQFSQKLVLMLIRKFRIGLMMSKPELGILSAIIIRLKVNSVLKYK